MVYTHKELKEKYGSDYQIQKDVKDGNLYKIEFGNINYNSLTDLVKYQNYSDPSFTIKNWLRRVNTIDYVGI